MTANRSSCVMVLAALCAVVLFMIPSVAVGEVRRICNVSYETREGWSQPVKVEVTFITGRELNKATRSFSYNAFSNYALIWFSQAEVAILEHSGLSVGVGPEFDNEDFVRMYRLGFDQTFTQVNGDSPSPRQWRIAGKTFGRFIDPRAEGR